MTQTVVITGANRGIGLQLARKYAARLDEVFAVVRRSNSELDEVEGVRVLEGIDVTQADAVETLRRELRDRDIDILINNAGVLYVDGLGSLDFENIRTQFEVNAIAPLRVTEALLPLITKPGGKVAIITSRMGSIEDGSGGMYGYRMSKAAVNMAGSSLAKDLAGDGVAVVLLHPGYVATDMTNHQGSVHPADSARALIERIDGLDQAGSGSFLHMNGDPLPW